MAQAHTPYQTIIFITFFLIFTIVAAAKPHQSPSNVERLMLEFEKEKISYLQFYFHEVIDGPNRTAVQVAAGPSTNTSVTGFGAVTMFDNPLTNGPDPMSKMVGRAQGMYAASSQQGLGFLMAMNFVFVEGKYKGSTLSVLGRNAVFFKVREMPVVGGSGLFRFARGYALGKTYKIDRIRAILEYNVFVMHY
ncbi:dirigent protein 22-like [Magnolia sinica]|uniref:dirigent protein 22-like n=1 Tax=Magnolia sinica TaxID=86752 RepID=UPI002658BA50|nr:dirigent protein 22-like [Magnolia sinica]